MRLFSIVLVITCLLALALPVFAGDGGPPPWCYPGCTCPDQGIDTSTSNIVRCPPTLPTLKDVMTAPGWAYMAPLFGNINVPLW